MNRFISFGVITIEDVIKSYSEIGTAKLYRRLKLKLMPTKWCTAMGKLNILLEMNFRSMWCGVWVDFLIECRKGNKSRRECFLEDRKTMPLGK